MPMVAMKGKNPGPGRFTVLRPSRYDWMDKKKDSINQKPQMMISLFMTARQIINS
jgi:hypothetical protein